MSTDDWVSVITTLGFPAFMALALMVAIGYGLGWVVWPWATKQYDKAQEIRALEVKSFVDTVNNFNTLLIERDKQRHAEHTEQIQVNAKQQQEFLQALTLQRVEFIQALSKRDDATVNVVQALDDLAEQVSQATHGKRATRE